MTVSIASLENNVLVMEVSIPLESTMLEGENAIEQALNEAGVVASGELLKQFDTDGSALQVGPTKFTSKGPVGKIYHTPYGDTCLARHVYQSPKGGSIFCPLDDRARIINSATPKLAKIVSHKYSKLSIFWVG